MDKSKIIQQTKQACSGTLSLAGFSNTAMTPIKNILLTAVLCTSCYTVNAQLNFSSVQDVWAYADAHSIQIEAANAAKTIAAKNVQQAYGSLLPAINANGAFTDNIEIQSTLIPANLFNHAAPAGTYTEATFGRRYIYNGNISAQLDIINTQDWFAVKTARLSNEIASLNIAKAKAALYTQLANSFYTCQLLMQAETLSAENLQTASILYAIAQNKFTEGTISEVTVNTALINKEKAARSLAIATENKELQLNNIKLLLNTNEAITIAVNKDTENNIVADSIFAQDPEVSISYTQMQVAKTQWQSSKAAFTPTLSALYQYNTQVAADEFLKFNNSNTIPQQYWSLRLSVPIFNGGMRKYQAQKAKIDYNQKQKEYENTKLQSDINDDNLLLAYNSSLNSYYQSKNILNLYQENDKHAERKLNEGLISLDDRLKVYADMIANQNEYLQSMSDYLIQQYRVQIRQTNFTK